jgi:hypothetical protein
MLTVVGQEMVAVLTEPRARATDDLQGVERTGRACSDPNDLSGAESLEGDFLYRAPDEA